MKEGNELIEMTGLMPTAGGLAASSSAETPHINTPRLSVVRKVIMVTVLLAAILLNLLFALEKLWPTPTIIAENNETTMAEISTTGKPTFVFHIGLPKTGTTFMQCTFCGFKNVSDQNSRLLLEDNYDYAGACPTTFECGRDHELSSQFAAGSISMSCFTSISTSGINNETSQYHVNPVYPLRGQDNSVDMPVVPCSKTETVLHVHKQGRNIFYSNEISCSYTDNKIKALADLLLPLFDAEILIFYRPLYSWLPSWYNQKTKKISKSTFWPGELLGGMAVPELLPFALDDRGILSDLVHDYEVIYRKHPAHLALDNYRMHFSNVQVIPMQRVSMFEYVFCDAIRNMPNFCKHVRDGTVVYPAGLNVAKSLDDDYVAVAAYKAGLVPKESKRVFVRQSILLYYNERNEKSGYEWPLKCWSQAELDRLESLSLELEQRLFNATWGPDWEEQHGREFAEQVAKKIFCSVDTEQVLKDPEWISFFGSKQD